MSEVKRYEIGGPDWEMDLSPIGEWVCYDDYAALEAERDALNKQLAETNHHADRWNKVACERRDEAEALRQQLAERDATIERLEAGIPRLQERAYQLRQQRDKLAGLLRESLATHKMWADLAPALSLCADIEAALAEVE